MGLIAVLVQGLLIKFLTAWFSEATLIKASLFGLGVSLIGCSWAFSLLTLAALLFPLVLTSEVIKTCVLSIITKVYIPRSVRFR